MSVLAVAEHTTSIERRGDGRPREVRSACSCGWAGPWVRVMGMVHGAEAGHLEEVEPPP